METDIVPRSSIIGKYFVYITTVCGCGLQHQWRNALCSLKPKNVGWAEAGGSIINGMILKTKPTRAVYQNGLQGARKRIFVFFRRHRTSLSIIAADQAHRVHPSRGIRAWHLRRGENYQRFPCIPTDDAHVPHSSCRFTSLLLKVGDIIVVKQKEAMWSWGLLERGGNEGW